MKKGTCQEIVPMEAVAGEAVASDPVPRLPMMIGEHFTPPAAAVHGLRVLMQLLEVEQHQVPASQMTMIGERLPLHLEQHRDLGIILILDFFI
jgi:hypothetical protein